MTTGKVVLESLKVVESFYVVVCGKLLLEISISESDMGILAAMDDAGLVQLVICLWRRCDTTRWVLGNDLV